MNGFHTGLAAEEIAERGYRALDCEILAHRWRGTAGEIDLIADTGHTIVFAEVKARKSIAEAAHAISPRQQSRMANTALEYLERHGLGGREMRFDAVLVDRQGRSEIRENAIVFDIW